MLASDVQVEGPTPAHQVEGDDEIDERDEVRFALTSEAGLNDGLAFPFVYLAIMVATMGSFTDWGLRWFGWELVGKVVVGVAIGTVVGWALARMAFRSRRPSLRLAETGEPLLALAAVLLSYGIAEVAGGYGFLAVFACGMALRSAERGHDYHVHMHGVVDRLERLLTLAVLLLLGVTLTNGLLSALTWEGALVGLALVFVVRPLAGWVALTIGSRAHVGHRALGHRERWATAAFGVRGVGSLYYLAYASNQTEFAEIDVLWATVGFTVALSVVVHGVAAHPVMRWLEGARGRADSGGQAIQADAARCAATESGDVDGQLVDLGRRVAGLLVDPQDRLLRRPGGQAEHLALLRVEPGALEVHALGRPRSARSRSCASRSCSSVTPTNPLCTSMNFAISYSLIGGDADQATLSWRARPVIGQMTDLAAAPGPVPYGLTREVPSCRYVTSSPRPSWSAATSCSPSPTAGIDAAADGRAAAASWPARPASARPPARLDRPTRRAATVRGGPRRRLPR